MATRPIHPPAAPGVVGEAVRLPFRDREEAGQLLAMRLTQFRGQHAVVLGIPRGGVPVARAVARAVEGELDVLVARKLGAPFQEELAIGAVTANGGRYLNQELIEEIGIPAEYLERVTAEQLAEARRRETRLRGGAKAPVLEGRVVILVDDGLATGATMRAAIRSVRAARPGRLVVAVPVAARDTILSLTSEVDELICLSTPEPFYAVGQHYIEFEQVSDERVEAILRQR